MAQRSGSGGKDSFGSLQDVLEVASELVRRMQEDPFLQRLLAVFNAMPADDRPTIVGVLEREVLGRHLSRGTEKVVGQSSRPNPHARLYIRAHETPADSVQFDFEQMRVANVRALRVATIIRYVPGIHDLFKRAIRAAMDEVDEATRAVAEGLLHDVLAAIADARAAEPAAVPAEPVEAAPEAPPDASEPPRRS